MLLNASQPDLLIANVLLPGGGDGARLAEEACRIDVPTLLISGHPEVIAKQETQGLPFLAKPSGWLNCSRRSGLFSNRSEQSFVGSPG